MRKSFFYAIIVELMFIVSVAALLFYNNQQRKSVYVWAWERPEDLRFLENSADKITIVYYAGDVVIKSGAMVIHPRRNKLLLPAGAQAMPLIRIDNFDKAVALTEERAQVIKNFIARACTVYGISGCQIDFDATVSERPAYAKIIAKLKKEIPNNISLSITALVSWCDGTSWLDDTAIDYAVPMFYRLGPDRAQIQNDRVGQTFMKSKKCQSAVGVSVDERMPDKKYLQGRDIYLFNPNPWNEENFNREIKLIK